MRMSEMIVRLPPWSGYSSPGACRHGASVACHAAAGMSGRLLALDGVAPPPAISLADRTDRPALNLLSALCTISTSPGAKLSSSRASTVFLI